MKQEAAASPAPAVPEPNFLYDTFEIAGIGLGLVSLSAHFLRANRQLCRELGFNPVEIIGKPFASLIGARDDITQLFSPWENPAQPGADRAMDLRCQRKDGTWYWGRVSATLTHQRDGRPHFFTCSIQDIHALKTAQETLAAERLLMVQQLRMQSAVFNASQEGMLIIAPEDHVISCNPAFSDISQYHSDELRGRHVSFLFAGQNNVATWPAIKAHLKQHGNWSGELWNRRKNGEVYLDWTTIHALSDDQGRLLNYVLTAVDLSRGTTAQGELSRLSLSDPLTGLPNRPLMMNRLSHALSRAKRNTSTGALMYIDLDGFTAINDRYGHQAGDELLKQTGQRLKQRLRDVDTVARVGGDEFVTILEEIRRPELAGTLAGELISALTRPYDLPEIGPVNISGSIGVSLFTEEAPDAAAIFAQADRALCIAKSAGRSCYRLAHQGASIN